MQKCEDFVFWANRGAPFCIACVKYGHLCVITELDFYLGRLSAEVLRNVQCHVDMYEGCVLPCLMLLLCSRFML